MTAFNDTRFVKFIRERINDTTTFEDPLHYGAEYWTPVDEGTSHFSIIDENGLAVSVTSTINTA
jgi:gamma-glutamyltranspeptidase/glutathione hydrolase/leukotriene-C4 hydrolase